MLFFKISAPESCYAVGLGQGCVILLLEALGLLAANSFFQESISRGQSSLRGIAVFLPSTIAQR